MTIQELEIFIEKYGKIIRKNMPSGTEAVCQSGTAITLKCLQTGNGVSGFFRNILFAK